MPKKTRPSARRWQFRHPRLIVDTDVHQALKRLLVQELDSQPSANRDGPASSKESNVPERVAQILEAFFQRSGGLGVRLIQAEQEDQEEFVRIPRELMNKLQKEARRLTEIHEARRHTEIHEAPPEAEKPRWQRITVKQVARTILVAYLAGEGITVDDGGGATESIN